LLHGTSGPIPKLFCLIIKSKSYIYYPLWFTNSSSISS
jgi:hypothetical protein